MSNQAVTKQTLKRLPKYLSYLKALPSPVPDHISATAIAEALALNDVLVRKDLAAVSRSGKPKVGYERGILIQELEAFLGFNDTGVAILAGAGKLGRALMDYEGFQAYGLNVVAGFDPHVTAVEYTPGGKPLYSSARMGELCRRLQVCIGIITVPAASAQQVCDELIACGVLAIWNFAPVHLKVPDGILVQQEDMAASLAVLSSHLREKLSK